MSEGDMEEVGKRERRTWQVKIKGDRRSERGTERLS